MLRCHYCGHEEPISLVQHISDAHESLADYLKLFPNARIVSPTLHFLATNAFISDEYLEKAAQISPQDRYVILQNFRIGQRSKILIS